jgi:hypothetical protein
LFDFDFGAGDRRRDTDVDVDVGGGAVDYRYGAGCYDGDDDDGADPTSALDNVDLSEVERRLEGALAGFDVPAASPESASFRGCDVRGEGEEDGECDGECDRECERSSSVWEDGEDFWNNRKRLSTIPGSSPSDAEKARMVQTPWMYSAVHGRRAALSLRSPGTGMATPGSLYDGAGFLKQ